MNIFNSLYKLSEKAADKLLAETEGSSLPSGYVTDGEGNIYAIPTQGETKLFDSPDADNVKFSYDWKNKEIKIYVDGEFFDSYNLNPENFVDGPEYWFKTAQSEYEDELQSVINESKTLEVSEAFDNKYNNKYFIPFEYYIIDDSIDDLDEFNDRFFKEYSVEDTLYNNDIHAEAYYDDISETPILKIETDNELTAADINELWSDYVDYIFSRFDSDVIEINRKD